MIITLDDGSEEAELALRLWDGALDTVLSIFPWAFATKRVALTELDDVERTGWRYVYEYPSDCVTARYIHPGEGVILPPEFAVPFEVQYPDSGDLPVIVCDIDEATLVYTARTTNTSLFPPLFADALAWYLASEMAFPLSARADLRQQAMNAWEQVRLMAAGRSLSESHQATPASPVLSIRGVS